MMYFMGVIGLIGSFGEEENGRGDMCIEYDVGFLSIVVELYVLVIWIFWYYFGV